MVPTPSRSSPTTSPSLPGSCSAGSRTASDLDAEIAKTVEQRDREIATRKRPLTGLTEFPNLAETLPERVPARESREVRRYGAAFEALRDDPPAGHVFLATMGTVAAHTARATFAANLLAAGGIAVDVAGATETADDLVAAYDGQQVVFLAGSDGAYDGWADEAVSSAARGRCAVGGHRRQERATRVDDSAAMGVDALEFLTRTREKLA